MNSLKKNVVIKEEVEFKTEFVFQKYFDKNGYQEASMMIFLYKSFMVLNI